MSLLAVWMSERVQACSYCIDTYSVLKIDESYVKNEEVNKKQWCASATDYYVFVKYYCQAADRRGPTN